MTDNHIPPVVSSTAEPGWYPDGTGPGAQRWWDGTRWTDHVHNPASPVAQQSSTQPSSSSSASDPTPGTPAPSGSPYNVFVWLIALLPLLSAATVFTWDLTAFLKASVDSAPSRSALAGLGAYSSLGAGYFVTLALGWVLYLVTALLAYFDFRRLAKQGYVRRFHWAWSFLGSLVYLIGRPVVLRSQGRAGFAVLWVYLGVTVFVTVITLAKVFSAMAEVMPLMTTRGY